MYSELMHDDIHEHIGLSIPVSIDVIYENCFAGCEIIYSVTFECFLTAVLIEQNSTDGDEQIPMGLEKVTSEEGSRLMCLNYWAFHGCVDLMSGT